MKVSFSKLVRFIPTWHGNDKLPEADQIKATLSVMSFSDLLKLSEGFGKNTDGNVDAEKVFHMAEDLIPKYVTVENLSTDDGPANQNDLVVYPIFMGLATEILIKLSEISTPRDNDEKN